MPVCESAGGRTGTTGEILDAEKMRKCVWVRPKLIAVVEFPQWTEEDRLRHSRFEALRDDTNPRSVVKEHSDES
jgi:ATP-dependent DNA ligase